MGTNATLVNLDTLIAPLPPPSSINPFGIAPAPSAVTPPTLRSSNPFESAKAPAPTLAQLQQGPNFGKKPSLELTTIIDTAKIIPHYYENQK